MNHLPPDWRGRRKFLEKVNWKRLPEFDVGVALYRQKRKYGWDNRWFLYFRRFNEGDVVSFPVFSQTVVTTPIGLTQSITSDATWNNADNYIDVIAGGGAGARGAGTTSSGGGGGGGAFTRAYNVNIPTPGTSVFRVRVGAGGNPAAAGTMDGGDSWWDIGTGGSPDIFPTSGTAVGARGGDGAYASGSPDVPSVTGAFGGNGGDASRAYVPVPGSPDRSIKTNGGKGGNAGASNASGGGGGGAGGNHANGAPGGAGPGVGGRGDGAVSPDTGGGAGGAIGSPGSPGGDGTNLDGVHGSGGGGGGANNGPGTGGAGGTYGGGGGGGGRSNGTGGAGHEGVVILNWNVAITFGSGDGAASAAGAAAADGMAFVAALGATSGTGAATGVGAGINFAAGQGRAIGFSEPIWDASRAVLDMLFANDFLSISTNLYSGPGDVVPGAAAWWGLRAYSSARIGQNAVRLKRSSDNAEQDFATIAGGGLDVAAILAFKGASTDLLPITLYDQTGNGNDASVVNSGRFNVSTNSPPTISCSNGLGTEFDAAGPTIASQPFSVSTVFIDDDGPDTGSFPVLFRSSATNTPTIFNEGSSIPNVSLVDVSTLTASSTPYQTWHGLQAVFNNTSSVINLSGTTTTGSVGGTDGVAATVKLFWNGFTGRFTELGVWGSAFTSPQQASLLANQQAYWADLFTFLWVDAVVAHGGTVSSARKTLVRALIDGLISDGVWSKLDRLWLFAAEDQPSALTDLVKGALATAVNSPTFTTDRGFVCNGTATVNSNFNPTTAGGLYQANSASFGGWKEDSAGSTGALVGNVASHLNPRWVAGDIIFTQINEGGERTAGTTTDASGFWVLTRTASNAWAVYRNGSSMGTGSDASTTMDNASFVASSGNTFDAMFIGAGLTSTDAANFNTRMRTYMTAVGVP